MTQLSGGFRFLQVEILSDRNEKVIHYPTLQTDWVPPPHFWLTYILYTVVMKYVLFMYFCRFCHENQIFLLHIIRDPTWPHCFGCTFCDFLLSATIFGRESPTIVFWFSLHTGLFISPSGISKLDCATTKRDTAERSITIGWEYLQVFFLY